MAAKKPAQRAKLSAFISHAKADAKKAQEIAASLEERGLPCWIAPRDVTAGRAYGDEIIRGIESAKAFVLVLSKASNGSSFVAREVERAVSKQKSIFVIRLANIEPAPALELFISGTQWIDAFPGRRTAHIDRLAKLLGEQGEAASAEHDEAEGKDRPRRRPWLWPAGAAAAVLIALGAAFALWPRPAPSTADTPSIGPALLTTPVLPDNREIAAREQVATAEGGNTAPILGGKPVTAGEGSGIEFEKQETGLNANLFDFSRILPGDGDFRACEKSSGDAAIDACDRAIASGKYAGRGLSYLYSDRGFMLMQKGEIDKAFADLNQAAESDPTNFYAYWNRGAIYAARNDLEKARADFTTALALNPDQTSKTRIEEALNAVSAGASEAKAEPADPGVITDPTIFGGGQQEGSASAASNYPADAMPMPAAPSLEPTIPSYSMPASPAPVPAR